MIKVKRIHHVAIAAGDCDASADPLARLFGLERGAREHVAGQRTDVVFLHPTPEAEAGQGGEGGEVGLPAPEPRTELEVISPAGNEALERFLARRGPGLHHICFEVEDLTATLASLKSAGVRLIDEIPRAGARGHLVAFLHPASTGGVLYELCASHPEPKA